MFRYIVKIVNKTTGEFKEIPSKVFSDDVYKLKKYDDIIFNWFGKMHSNCDDFIFVIEKVTFIEPKEGDLFDYVY